MTDTPDDPPPYVMGPGPDYDPPPLEALIDPAVRDETATKGAALVREVLADLGHVKVGEKWTRTTTTNEGTER